VGRSGAAPTHIDHINGLILPNGRDAFPQFSWLLVPKAELGLFRTEARLERFHARAEPFEPGRRLGANIEALAAAGHEIGHTCFRITSEGETTLIWGDIVHVPSLQFDKPDIAWDDYVAGAHLDSPGVGRVSRVGNSFRFDPL
jgi:glyoxylase-like metal-dependent hydrolase (beta-lactamase superfamily II)